MKETPTVQQPAPPQQPPLNPPPTYQPPQKPPRSRKRLWLIIGIVAAVLVISAIGSNIASSGGQQTTTPQATQVVQPTTPPAQPTATQAPTEKPTPQIVLHKQNEEVKTGGYTVSIEIITTNGVHKYSDLKPGQYVEGVSLAVTVPSDGSSTWVSRVMVNMTDMQGNTIEKVNTLTPMHWTPKPGMMTAIYNEFILTHGGNYILSFKGISGETVYWSVTI